MKHACLFLLIALPALPFIALGFVAASVWGAVRFGWEYWATTVTETDRWCSALNAAREEGGKQ